MIKWHVNLSASLSEPKPPKRFWLLCVCECVCALLWCTLSSPGIRWWNPAAYPADVIISSTIANGAVLALLRVRA